MRNKKKVIKINLDELPNDDQLFDMAENCYEILKKYAKEEYNIELSKDFIDGFHYGYNYLIDCINK